MNLCCWWIQVRFIIMGNLFCSEYTIHRRFDLKGSSLGRTTDKAEAEIDETTILKDLDLNFIFRLQKSWFQEFRRWNLVWILSFLMLHLISILLWYKSMPNCDCKIPNSLFFFLLLSPLSWAECLFYRQIDRDCEFLEQERIMDYSLLVGLHFLEKSMAGDLIPSGARTPIGFFLSLLNNILCISVSFLLIKQ